MKNTWAMTGLIAVVVGGLAFWGGIQYQSGKDTSAASTRRGRFAGQFGQLGGQGANGQRVQPVRGSIISSDASSITVKQRDGSTKIVLLSDSTTISKATTGSKADLQTGNTVMVLGNQNSDGSVTAQNIQLNPPGFGAASPQPSR